MNNDYKYSELPLQPRLASELILEVFTGQIVKRKTIISAITKLHHSKGGKSEDKNYTATFKKALQYLEKEGKAKSLTKGGGPIGYWQIGSISDFSNGNQHEGVETPSTSHIAGEKRVVKSGKPEKTIGTGEGAVYLFYHDNDKHRAESEGKSFWQCKIGMTERDPIERIKAQTSTATAEPPKTYVFRTDTPDAMEKAIHAILDACGKRVKSSRGKEWFITSPDEVENIYTGLIVIMGITSKTV